MKKLRIESSSTNCMSSNSPGHRSGQPPERVRKGNVEFSIRFAPESQDIFPCQGLEIGIFEDVQDIVPLHKLIAGHLPKNGERHEEQEGCYGIGYPEGSNAVGGRRTGGKAWARPVRDVSHCCSLRERYPTT